MMLYSHKLHLSKHNAMKSTAVQFKMKVEIVTSIQHRDHERTSLQRLFHVKWLVRKISEKKANPNMETL